MIAAGVPSGVVAAVPGASDREAIPSCIGARRVVTWHRAGNAVVPALFVVAWLVRRDAPATAPGTALVLGLVVVAVTGWLGGELVDRPAVDIDRGARRDAPNPPSGPESATLPAARRRAF